VLEDHPPGADPPDVVGEVGQEVELLGGEVERLAVEGGLVVDEVEPERADDELGRFVLPVVGGVVSQGHPMVVNALVDIPARSVKIW